VPAGAPAAATAAAVGTRRASSFQVTKKQFE